MRSAFCCASLRSLRLMSSAASTILAARARVPALSDLAGVGAGARGAARVPHDVAIDVVLVDHVLGPQPRVTRRHVLYRRQELLARLFPLCSNPLQVTPLPLHRLAHCLYRPV